MALNILGDYYHGCNHIGSCDYDIPAFWKIRVWMDLFNTLQDINLQVNIYSTVSRFSKSFQCYKSKSASRFIVNCAQEKFKHN
jgi:hypothetical protein